jgi:excinuclease ABC subunit A
VISKTADYCVDLGPEGGLRGGRVVAVGSPEELARQAEVSYTGQFLEPFLERERQRHGAGAD